MKLRMHGILLGLLLMPTVRVAVLKDIPAVTVEGEELRIQDESKPPLSTYIPSPVHVSATEGGLQAGEDYYTSSVLKFSTQGKTLSINGKLFEGVIEVREKSSDSLLVLNEIPVENYLVGLLHGEIDSHWPKEVLKAQAVAARTYALFRQEQRKGQTLYDLESDTSDQVYVGSKGEIKDSPVKAAIAETQGEVLWYLGYFPAYFHSCCGGQTETADHVWGRRENSESVQDKFCKDAPYRNWELVVTQRQLLHRLNAHGLEGKRIESILLEKQESSPRNALVIIETDQNTLFLGATELRKILGYNQLMSTWFDIHISPRQVTFKGTGFGHGVGMCQWGAKAMAEAGHDYKSILKHYYPKAAIRKLYP